jgi:membrane protease YdiL (CAAX protease family)
VSSDPNPPPSQPELPTDVILPSAPEQTLTFTPEPPPRDPVWSGWDVMLLVVIALAAVFFSSLIAVIIAALLPSNHGRSIQEIAASPRLNIAVTTGVYLLLVPAMVLLIRLRYRRPFWETLQWRPPARWWVFPVIGVLTGIGAVVAESVYPMPKNLPIEKMFSDRATTWVMVIFGVFCAPVVEELFFRGFLYPVLRHWRALFTLAILAVGTGIVALLYSLVTHGQRTFWFGLGVVIAAGLVATMWLFSGASSRVGAFISILLTSLFFALIHSEQLAHSLAPLVVIFSVGVVLTTIRAGTGSVAASTLAHMGYNGLLFCLLFIQTDHFRHLERLQQ